MGSVDLVGLAAAALTTAAFVPQLARIWRRRSAADVSPGMYAVLIAGVVLWIGYGLAIGSLPMVLANAATLAQCLAVLWLKRRFG